MEEDDLPRSYYELNSDQLKLLQFLLYHLKYKVDNKKKKLKKVEIKNSKEVISFE